MFDRTIDLYSADEINLTNNYNNIHTENVS